MLTLTIFFEDSITVLGSRSNSCRPSPYLVPSERQRIHDPEVLYLPTMHMAERATVKSTAMTIRTDGVSLKTLREASALTII